MNNIKAINNIGYEGFVNFKIYQKKKLRNNFTIHNAGQAGLFNFLAACLSGRLEADMMPKYLSFSAGSESTSKIQYAEIVVSQTTNSVSEAGLTGPTAKATYMWTVPITDFGNLNNHVTIDSITVTLSNAAGNACATATITADKPTTQAFTLLKDIIETQNTNYIVVVAWQLIIGNIPTT